MNLSNRKICFTTLALGSKYRQHALTLAKDIQILANNTPFVILTDEPSIFTTSESLIPLKHQIQSVGVYHDKLDCVAESFRLGFDDCIFLDADCRLLENAVASRNWKLGLTPKCCYDLKKHLLSRNVLEPDLYKFVDEIARKYDVQIEQCKFILEWIFVACKDGNEEHFIQSWREIRDILEMKRIFAGEGVALGMAAKIAGWAIHHYDTGYPEEASRHQIIDIYKDKLFLKKDSIPDAFREKIHHLDCQRQMIERQHSRKINKLTNLVAKEVRYVKLKFRNLLPNF